MPSEFNIIDHYFRHNKHHKTTDLGIGDDAAIFHHLCDSRVVVSCDTLVEGVHFDAHITPRAIGWKSLAVSVSDLLAMGALPRTALLALAMPVANSAWLTAFREGFFACAEIYGIDLIGGDTVFASAYQITVTVMGELVHEPLRRDGASCGDDLWLTGKLGLPALALQHQRGTFCLSESVYTRCLEALSYPSPPFALLQGIAPFLSSAIDISDGFLQDLSHLLTPHADMMALCVLPQKVYPPVHGREAEKPVRQAMLWGGEDYQLLCTSAPHHRADIIHAHSLCASQTPLTRIGQMMPREKSACFVLLDGECFSLDRCQQGFRHFSSQVY